ncbi:uncharacterized protein LOC106173136 [Lingula anatina]|uniref:Uncharacterized protein LOC106173136 n=1 Tax=Lingula anatina TaxID=7574 RepID=A0A1S3JGR9_LINAN|nr:uncharacterized protein LOC106173136 [Lingula anatina]|eukprot:XP_013409592.1 uncharacterized protein LOC106173136 [Lingula anatina]
MGSSLTTEEENPVETDSGDESSEETQDTPDTGEKTVNMAEFKTGNIVQLVSKSSSKTLEIVRGADGQLMLDGMGPEGAQFQHANWTVVKEDKDVIRLHNCNNYIVIVDGKTMIVNYPPGAQLGCESKLIVRKHGDYYTFGSMEESDHHLGIKPEGALKAASNTREGPHAQFTVKVLYSPYAPDEYYPTKQ